MWRLTGAQVLHTVALTAVGVHLIAFLLDTGVSAAVAAGTSGGLGILSVAGRITVTRSARHVGLARLAAAIVAGQAIGVAALLALPRPAGLLIFVVLFGAGFGVMTIARPALLGAYVTAGSFASTSGRQALAANAGRVLAPLGAGLLISSWGYTAAFTVVAVSCLGSAAFLVAADAASRTRAPAAP